MPNQIPVYSPSFTKGWDKCQLQSYLEKHEKWVPRVASPALIARLAGSAFADATAVIHNDIREGAETISTLWPVEIAKGAFETTIKVYRDAGGYVPMEDFQRAEDALLRAIPKYVKDCPFQGGWTIEGVELVLEDYGPCRMDLVGTESKSGKSIVDLKYKRYLPNDNVDFTIQDYCRDWQFYHYDWAAKRYFGLPAVASWLCLVVAEPRWQVRLVELPLSDSFKRVFETAAVAKWERMQVAMTSQTKVLEVATEHRDRWGVCPMADACFKYGLDPELMDEGYIKVDWPRKVALEVE